MKPETDPQLWLTTRELEVLKLSWYSNREIALMLDMAHGTVKNTKTSIFLKLGVYNGSWDDKTMKSILAAVKYGVISLDDIEVPEQSGWHTLAEPEKKFLEEIKWIEEDY